jgi:hypothetical protein
VALTDCAPITGSCGFNQANADEATTSMVTPVRFVDDPSSRSAEWQVHNGFGHPGITTLIPAEAPW